MTDIRSRHDHRLASIKTEIELNWRELGEEFMARNSEEQARFLIGFEAEADSLGYLREDHQYAYIASAIPDERVRESIADRLRRLADRLTAKETTDEAVALRKRAEAAEAQVARVRELAKDRDVFYPPKFKPTPSENYVLGWRDLQRKIIAALDGAELNNLPLHRTEANYGITCSTCDGGGCFDCTDPAS